MAKTSNLYRHALSEFRLNGMLGTGDPLPNTLPFLALTIIDVIDDHGFRDPIAQGTVAMIANMLRSIHVHQLSKSYDKFGIETVARLLSHLPLSSVTGDSKEWIRSSKSIEYNKRCPRIVRESGERIVDTARPRADGGTAVVEISLPYFPERRI